MGFPRAWLNWPIGAIFAAQVQRDPRALAVKSKRWALRYGELAAKANALARAILAARGPGSEPIALMFEHDAPVLAAILGVLSAGKAYVVLDAHFPGPQLAAILADCQAPLVVCDAAHRDRARELAKHADATVLEAEVLDPTPSTEPVHLEVSARAPACVAYTSGSTGDAKGVVGDHRSITHRAMVLIDAARVGPGDRLSLLESVAVGGSFRGIFGALLSGATTVPLDLRAEGTEAIAPWLVQERITVCMAAASVFRRFATALPAGEHFPDLRYLGIGREPVLRSDVELFRSRFSAGCVLVNVMGSAEAGTICELTLDRTAAFTGDLAPDESVLPVGHPVPDKEVLVLDDAGRPVPPGDVGEIAVRSEFLAVGYWRRPDLDAAVFSGVAAGAPGRVCRTGDLGRVLPDGRLVLLGRKDARAKLRGRFVDTSKIESALMRCDGIQGAAVVIREDGPGDQRLVAYVVQAKDGALTAAGVLRAARPHLDALHTPAAIVFLDALPLTPNGKIDRRALPAPPRTRPLGGPPQPPRTRIEADVERVWAMALDLPEVGVYDDFIELGGTSLVAVRIAALVSDRFAVDIPVRTLLDAPTVADMAIVVTAHLLARDDPDADELGRADGGAGAGGW